MLSFVESQRSFLNVMLRGMHVDSVAKLTATDSSELTPDSWKERDKSGVIRALHVGTENVHSGWMETGQTSKEKRQAEGKGYFSQSSPSAVLSLWCCTHQHPGSSCSMATEEGLCLSLHKKACLPFQPATQDLRDTEKPRADLVWSKGSFHNGFM